MASIEPSDPIELVTTSEQVIPVLEETVRIEKRLVTSSRANVHVTVSEHDQVVNEMLLRQDVAIDRVTIGTFVTEAPAIRKEGDTIIVPIFEERLVMEKRLFVTEELHIRINEHRQPSTQTVRLRREHAEITTQQMPEAKGTP